MAWPFSGLHTQTLRSRQSKRPTWGYLPLNFSVQSFVETRGPVARAPLADRSRLPKPNMGRRIRIKPLKAKSAWRAVRQFPGSRDRGFAGAADQGNRM